MDKIMQTERELCSRTALGIEEEERKKRRRDPGEYYITFHCEEL